jgi:hypothetical protein
MEPLASTLYASFQQYYSLLFNVSIDDPALSAKDDRERDVDIVIRVLDAPDGARAEGLLSWEFEGGWLQYVDDRRGA